MNQCRQKINQVMQKQYAVEQLNLTAMQIETLQETVGVFETFNKKHNIDKIEELQNTMADLTDQVMDINETIGSEPLLDDFDEDELLKELNSFDVQESNQVLDLVEVPLELPEIKISDKVALLQ
tara:strand:- start:396 stop:767 length:372 start_codon:yes stop_codon:yes gene_type:complete